MGFIWLIALFAVPASVQERVVEINEEVLVEPPLSEVWKALTTAEGLAGWVGDSTRIELKVAASSR